MPRPLTLLLEAVFAWYVSALVQTLFHRWFGHARRIEAIHEAHTFGHHAVYGRDRLLADRWLPAERSVVGHYAWPMLAIAAVIAILGDWAVCLAFAAGVLASLAWHVWLHRHYHRRGSGLRRFGWFRRKRALHFEHHLMARSNYAISEFWIDRLFGTWRGPRALSLAAAEERVAASAGGTPAHRQPVTRRVLEP